MAPDLAASADVGDTVLVINSWDSVQTGDPRVGRHIIVRVKDFYGTNSDRRCAKRDTLILSLASTSAAAAGLFADRTKEHLATSDRGILMLRKRFLSDLDRIAQGHDPKAIIRDAELNKCVPLPVADRDILIGGLPFEQLRAHPVLGHELRSGYPFQTGQPEEVRRLYEEAMGITPGGKPESDR